MRGMFRKVFFFSYLALNLFLFSHLVSCTGGGLSGGGTIDGGSTVSGPQNLPIPPGNPTQIMGGSATPGAEEAAHILNPSPSGGGHNLVEIKGRAQGICQGSGDSKKVLIKGSLYMYTNVGDWLGHPIWIDPKPLTNGCQVRVVFPHQDGLHFKDGECTYPPGKDAVMTLQGLAPANNYFEMSFSTTAITDPAPPIFSLEDRSYFKDPRYIRIALKDSQYDYPQPVDDSCNEDSCLEKGWWGVHSVIEYMGFEDLPECPRLEKIASSPVQK